MAEKSTRDRILAAARTLFYDEGIRAVGTDAIVTRAGVTKPTLYYYFASKDDLVAAYLEQRNAAILASVEKPVAATRGPVASKVAAIFASVARATPNRRWKGCPIVRGAAEFAADPDHPVRRGTSAHKKAIELWFKTLLAGHGQARAALKARQIAVLLDGAVIQAFMHGDPAYARAAGAAARALLGGMAADRKVRPKRSNRRGARRPR